MQAARQAHSEAIERLETAVQAAAAASPRSPRRAAISPRSTPRAAGSSTQQPPQQKGALQQKGEEGKKPQMQSSPSNFEAMDRNGDGVIDKDEWNAAHQAPPVRATKASPARTLKPDRQDLVAEVQNLTQELDTLRRVVFLEGQIEAVRSTSRSRSPENASPQEHQRSRLAMQQELINAEKVAEEAVMLAAQAVSRSSPYSPSASASKQSRRGY